MPKTDLYDADIVAWAEQQAHWLRVGALDRLDLEHLAEEIEDVGKSEQRELANRLSLLLAHLLKWQFQPERRGSSWHRTIREQRRAIKARLDRTPSLEAMLRDATWLDEIWADAVADAVGETGLSAFPGNCPWRLTDVLEVDWLPPE
jgi:type I site-specific restriction endonuclease